MQESRITIDGVLKFQTENLTVKNHAIYMKENIICFPLQLWCTFSFFHTRHPTHDELKNCKNIFLTPGAIEWDPYFDYI